MRRAWGSLLLRAAQQCSNGSGPASSTAVPACARPELRSAAEGAIAALHALHQPCQQQLPHAWTCLAPAAAQGTTSLLQHGPTTTAPQRLSSAWHSQLHPLLARRREQPSFQPSEVCQPRGQAAAPALSTAAAASQSVSTRQQHPLSFVRSAQHLIANCGRQPRHPATAAAAGHQLQAARHSSGLSRVRVPKSAAFNDTVVSNITTLEYGQFGIRALTGKRVAANTIEAVRRTLRRKLKKTAALWVRIRAEVPVTRKPEGIRMGKGKGAIAFYACAVRPGQVIFEMDRVPRKVAMSALEAIQPKFPCRLGFVEWR